TRRRVDGGASRRSLHRTAAKVSGDRERRPRRGSRTWANGGARHSSNQAGDGFRLHRKNGGTGRSQRLSRFSRSAIHRETRTEARARIPCFRKLSLERRDVLLAGFHLPREPEEFFAKDTRGAG